MKKFGNLLWLLSLGLLLGKTGAATLDDLDPHLAPLRPWLGKTWKGHLKASTPDKPVVDIAHWARALNGKAVRIVHSVNDGAYGGESFIRWDETKKAVVYHYFTTAGFMTTGTMVFKDGRLLTHELVGGSAGKITEVRAVTEMKADGSFVVKSEHRQNKKWLPARETTYREEPGAQVRFK